METMGWMRNDKYFPKTACPLTGMAPTTGSLGCYTWFPLLIFPLFTGVIISTSAWELIW